MERTVLRVLREGQRGHQSGELVGVQVQLQDIVEPGKRAAMERRDLGLFQGQTGRAAWVLGPADVVAVVAPDLAAIGRRQEVLAGEGVPSVLGVIVAVFAGNDRCLKLGMLISLRARLFACECVCVCEWVRARGV